MGVGVTRRSCMSFAVAACLALPTALPAGAQTPLKLTLDGKLEGPAAPFLVALEQGYFKAEGLEVTIEASAGALEPITRVASGAFDIGIGDMNMLIRYHDQNPAAPLKAVFVVNNRPSYAIIGRKSRGVSAPTDLEGKKLGAPAIEQASAQWPIFAKLNQLDAAKVSVINVGIAVREPMLMAGEVDAVTGVSFSSPIVLREKGVPADDIAVLLMSAYGLDLYGNAIFVNSKVLAEKPEAVKGFLRALTQGLKETLREPVTAVLAVVRRNGGATRDLELERLLIAIRDCIVTAEVRANGLGAIDSARFDTGIEQMALGHTFKNKPKLVDIFDASFLPADAERKLD